MKKVYLSFPISHFDIEERREFAEKREKILTEVYGYEVVNPLKNGLDASAHWREHMKRDLKLLLECDTICLCEGYRESLGCHLEYKTAKMFGIDIISIDDNRVHVYEDVEVNSQRWLSLDNLNNELWCDIEGYEGYYQVSNYGRVKSMSRVIERKSCKQTINERILVQTKSDTGYYCISLKKLNKRRYIKVHKLVAKYFVENSKNEKCVNHIDEDKGNNHYLNLEFCSYSYNLSYMHGHKMRSVTRMRNHPARCVSVYDKNGVFIRDFINSREAAKWSGQENSRINECCNKKRKTAGGYIFKWKDLSMR